jgi:hypothetical protein
MPAQLFWPSYLDIPHEDPRTAEPSVARRRCWAIKWRLTFPARLTRISGLKVSSSLSLRCHTQSDQSCHRCHGAVRASRAFAIFLMIRGVPLRHTLPEGSFCSVFVSPGEEHYTPNSMFSKHVGPIHSLEQVFAHLKLLVCTYPAAAP